jgi:hypothetical protein
MAEARDPAHEVRTDRSERPDEGDERDIHKGGVETVA